MRWLGALCLGCVIPLGASDLAEAPKVESIIARFVAADNVRRDHLEGYRAQRRYVMLNERMNKRAEVLAQVEYRKPGEKKFRIVSESGPGLIRSKVLRRMIEAETEASEPRNRRKAEILPENYNFRLLGTDTTDGRHCFVVELQPKSASKYLIRGKAWIDAADYAVVRLEGTPAQNPSFWTRETRIVHRYGKHGEFWLPAFNSSITEARLFGKTEVTISYFDYRLD